NRIVHGANLPAERETHVRGATDCAADAGIATDCAADAGIATDCAADAGIATDCAADAGIATDCAADAGMGPLADAAELSAVTAGRFQVGPHGRVDPPGRRGQFPDTARHAEGHGP